LNQNSAFAAKLIVVIFSKNATTYSAAAPASLIGIQTGKKLPA